MAMQDKIEALNKKIKENTPPPNRFYEFLVKHWQNEIQKLEIKATQNKVKENQ